MVTLSDLGDISNILSLVFMVWCYIKSNETKK